MLYILLSILISIISFCTKSNDIPVLASKYHVSLKGTRNTWKKVAGPRSGAGKVQRVPGHLVAPESRELMRINGACQKDTTSLGGAPSGQI